MFVFVYISLYTSYKTFKFGALKTVQHPPRPLDGDTKHCVWNSEELMSSCLSDVVRWLTAPYNTPSSNVLGARRGSSIRA